MSSMAQLHQGPQRSNFGCKMKPLTDALAHYNLATLNGMPMPRQESAFSFMSVVILLSLLLLSAPASIARAQTETLPGDTTGPRPEGTTFEVQEIVTAGHQFFGQTSIGLASVVEYVFAEKGRPVGYIVGEEASAAFFGGLRYGEGELRLKSGERQKVYWQGPTLGFDIGGDGSRVMVLVYGMSFPNQVYDTFNSAGGMAYIAGGLGVNFQTNPGEVALAVIRTGVGLRLGVNLGYIKYTPEATWNPF